MERIEKMKKVKIAAATMATAAALSLAAVPSNAHAEAVVLPFEITGEGGGTATGWYSSGGWTYKVDPETNSVIADTPYWKWESPGDVWTAKMYMVHDTAEMFRAIGYDSNHPIMKALSAEWWNEKNTLDMLAKTVYYEAGTNSFPDDIAQQKVMNYVAQVVLNRVNDARFPSTVYEVLTQPGQYSANYTYGFDGIPLEAYFSAVTAMDGNAGLAADVVYQANFPQGQEIFEVFYSRYNTTMYFCR